MLLLAGGFGMLVIELVWMGHTRDTQVVAVIATGIGFILALVGAFVGGRARIIVAGLLAVLALTGLFGTFEHAEARAGNADRRPPPGVNVTGDQAQPPQGADPGPGLGQGPGQGQRGGFPGRGNQAPLLSPLSVSGLALMGMVVLQGTRREDTVSPSIHVTSAISAAK